MVTDCVQYILTYSPGTDWLCMITGLLKDIFGRYDEAFFLGGAAMAMAGLLMVVSNIYMTLQRRRHAHAEIS